MQKKTWFAAFLLIHLLSIHCYAQKSQSTNIPLDKQHVVLLLDSTEAAQYIVRDPIDHFFERVTATEMSIQMKRPLDANQTRETMVDDYKKYLQTDVSTFSKKDIRFVKSTFETMFPVCNSFAHDIFPDTLVLIKTKARHYGEGVYYTRTNTIVIPYDALENPDETTFRTTMYHELFHVYSRLHPEKRAELYALIGFHDVGYNQLVLPPPLAERVLHNPDGVDFAQSIQLKTSDSSFIFAIPIIFSTEPGYKSGKSAFFNYLDFNLYEIRPLDEGKWQVLCSNNSYKSTLNIRKLPDFYRQIRDNTNYIIHPDEVLADNFAFVMLGKENPETLGNYSIEGQALLQQVTEILKK